MKTVSLIKNIFPAACFILIMTGCMPSIDESGRTQTVIDSISVLFVPDHRMGISDIKVKTGAEGTMILNGETTSALLKETIIKALSNHDNKLIDSILILPDTINNKQFTGLATVSVINIRKQPAHSSELVSQAVLGTPVRILKTDDSWLLIETPDHYIGWTESSSVESMTVKMMEDWKRSDRVITLVNSGWIYSSPGESGIVGDFGAGCIFVKTGDIQGYTKVRLPDGRQGFLNNKSVTDFDTWKANVNCTGENIVRSASTLIGLPYLWGGTSSRAVDCSGFSKTVYFLNGLILFRDASQQALHGLDVEVTPDWGQMKPGDLLFFGSGENSKLHVTHVAIYTGDSEYINSSGRVQINSLDSTRSNYNNRAKSLLAVKRVIGAIDDPGIIRINSHPWY
jgi:gamma-D-glutamyl-L-lysine dipeptidyl-peptidase